MSQDQPETQSADPTIQSPNPAPTPHPVDRRAQQRCDGEVQPESLGLSLDELLPSLSEKEDGETFNDVGSLTSDLEVELKIELGHTRIKLEEFLHLRNGAVIKLDESTKEPVCIFANDQLIARGEVQLLKNHYCIRVTELIGA
ncbi:MAG: FliM/FliN family flagellar motor switch protein [Planctomycetota bacterium]|nr:FliM/FliN family flagellar motor switch protein [Planctomycetota bacterium]